MEKKGVDKEKVIKHINYTKFWLDKAIKEYATKGIIAGNIILNIARAELTSAWEEAQQIKKFISQKKKTKEWKAISSLSLLASGFIIAILLFHFTTTYYMSESMPTIEKSSHDKITENIQQPKLNEISKSNKLVKKTFKKHQFHTFKKTQIKEAIQDNKITNDVLVNSSKEENQQSTEIKTLVPENKMDLQTTNKQEGKEISELGKLEAIDLLKTAEKALKE